MSLQGPLVVVAEAPAPDLLQALAEAGAFPVVETRWSDAPAAFVSIQPCAIIVAEPGPAADEEAARTLSLQLKTRSGPFVPLIGRANPGSPAVLPDALPVDAEASPGRLVARLRNALRIRALHATVLRRAETLAGQTGFLVSLPETDPLDDATVMVTGRGGSYPALAIAVGESVGLIGALSIDTAAKYLAARELDGIVISDGFSSAMVQGLLTALAEDVRFRDLPIAVVGGSVIVQPFEAVLANLERLENRPAQVLDWMLPLVRLRAFEARLKRMLKALEADGMIDPETGLLTEDAFWREMSRAVQEAGRNGAGLCAARITFDAQTGGRTQIDAARLISGIVRNIDFAFRDRDGSILIVFTETELRAGHIVARRIAGMLRQTMQVGERDPHHPVAVTLGTLKPSDTVETLVARVSGETQRHGASAAVAVA